MGAPPDGRMLRWFVGALVLGGLCLTATEGKTDEGDPVILYSNGDADVATSDGLLVGVVVEGLIVEGSLVVLTVGANRGDLEGTLVLDGDNEGE